MVAGLLDNDTVCVFLLWRLSTTRLIGGTGRRVEKNQRHAVSMISSLCVGGKKNTTCIDRVHARLECRNVARGGQV